MEYLLVKSIGKKVLNSPVVTTSPQDLASDSESCTDTNKKSSLTGDATDFRQLYEDTVKQLEALKEHQGTDHVEKFVMEQKEKKLEKGLAERDEMNGKLKTLLKDQQTSAEKLRLEVQRLSTEVEEKNRMIRKLQDKVKDLESHSRFMDSVDAGRESVERTRHGTGSGVREPTIQSVYTAHQELESDDSFSPSGKRTGSHSSGVGGARPGYGADLDGAQDSDDLVTSPTGSNRSGGHRLNKLGYGLSRMPSDHSVDEIASHSRQMHGSPEQERREHLEAVHPADLPSGLSDIPSSDRLFPSSITERTDSREQINRELQLTHQREIDSLKSRLIAVEDLNDSMRKELRIYDNIKTSVGIQSSPVTGSHASQTAANEPGAVFLERDLQDIRVLRQQLEVSIKRNDKLREQLEKNLGTSALSSGGTTNIYLPSGELADGVGVTELYKEVLRLKQHLREKRKKYRLVDRLARDIIDLKNQVNNKNAEIRSKNKLLSEKELTYQRQAAQIEALREDLKNSTKEAKKFKDEVNRLQEQVVENKQLNDTLQLELSVYDKMHDEKKAPSEKSEAAQLREALGVDLNLLLEEIRQLRVQLVRAIENNNSLRAKLEEQLMRNPHRQAAPSSNINIHHVYAAPTGSSPPTKDEEPSELNGNTSGSLEELRNSAKRQLFGRSRVHSVQAPQEDQGDETSRTYHSLPVGGSLRSSLTSLTLSPSNRSPKNISHSNRLQRSEPRLSPIRTSGVNRSDPSMRYSVYDPHRPPNESPGRVGADLRCLYAIGEIDDYELLKRDIGESLSVLSNMEVKIKDRLRSCKLSTPTQSLEYSTLRNMSITLENLSTIIKDEQRLVNLFWFSQLPRRDHSGHHFEARFTKENDRLRDDIIQWRKKYLLAKEQLGETEGRLNSSQKQKEALERIVQQLTDHHSHLKQASSNLKVAASH